MRGEVVCVYAFFGLGLSAYVCLGPSGGIRSSVVCRVGRRCDLGIRDSCDLSSLEFERSMVVPTQSARVEHPRRLN